MLWVIFAPTVVGQSMLDVTTFASAATSHSVGTRMSSAYQYQPPRFLESGSNGVLVRMPCFAGETPVTIVACAGYVTVGVMPMTPLADVPSFAIRRRFG